MKNKEIKPHFKYFRFENGGEKPRNNARSYLNPFKIRTKSSIRYNKHFSGTLKNRKRDIIHNQTSQISHKTPNQRKTQT